MSRDQQLAAIRAVCIKANPSDFRCNDLRRSHVQSDCPANRPIRLADVLLAIWKHTKDDYDISEFSQGVVMRATEPRHLITIWDLRKDDVAQQSEETIKFLADLLV